jgi:transketolase
MVSFAAAYASESRATNFVYTINPFVTSRVHDQLRVDVAYANSPLVICSVGAGFAYDSLGFTHFGIEDLSLMQVLPNFRIYTPSDPQDVSNIVEQLLQEMPLRSPVYLRLQKGGENNLNAQYSGYKNLGSHKSWDGTDLLVITHGAIAEEALQARDILKSEISVGVHAVIDWDAYLAGNYGYTSNIVILEEHRRQGSLAQTLISNFVESGHRFEKLKCLHINRADFDFCISREMGLRENFLDSESICKAIKTLMK